jgi:hypothetical protein
MGRTDRPRQMSRLKWMQRARRWCELNLRLVHGTLVQGRLAQGRLAQGTGRWGAGAGEYPHHRHCSQGMTGTSAHDTAPHSGVQQGGKGGGERKSRW